MSSNWYGEDGTNGTCSVHNGSPNVTFSAANLLTNNAATQGDGFKGPDGVSYGISAVTDDNAITLNRNYGGADNAAGAWAIIPLLGGRSVALTKLVSTLLNSGSYSSMAALAPNVGDFAQCTGVAPTTWSNRSAAQVLVSLLGAAGEANVASAANCDIGAQTSVKLSITGATGITSFNPAAGTMTPNAVRFLRFTGAVTLTNSANLILPGGANITTAAGDTAIFTSDNSATPVWRCWSYQRASGVPAGFTTTGTGQIALSSSPTLTGINLGYTTTFFNVDGTLSNYSSSNYVYLTGNAGGGCTINGAGNLEQQVQISGAVGGGPINFYTSGVLRAAIAAGGQLGLGMTPSNILDITQNQNGASSISLLNTNGGGAAYASLNMANGTNLLQVVQFGTGNNSGLSQINSNSELQFATNSKPITFHTNFSGSENGRVDTGGNLLWGTTTTGGVTGVAKVAVVGGAGTFAISAQMTGGSGSAFFGRTDATSAPMFQGNYQGTNVCSITTNGSTGSFNTTSARALKMGAQALDVSAMFDGPSIMYRGKWIAQPDLDWVGGIADEMATLVPEGYLPSTTPDLAPHQDGYVPDQFDYTKWVPYLVAEAFRARAAEKAAQQQIETLTASLSAIQARLTAAGIA